MQHVLSRSSSALAVVHAALVLAGCAHAYVDPVTGQRHIAGLVHLTFPAVPAAAETLRTRSLGLLLSQDAVTALSVGFTETSVTLVRPDSCAAFAFARPPLPAPEPSP